MKIKTHSGLKKRVRIKKGKLYFKKAGKNHLLSNKSKRQKRMNDRGKLIENAHVKKIRKLLPYS